MEKKYLTEKEASQRYGYSVFWFQRSRWKGNGPKFIKVNRHHILYPVELTDQWFESFPLRQSSKEI